MADGLLKKGKKNHPHSAKFFSMNFILANVNSKNNIKFYSNARIFQISIDTITL